VANSTIGAASVADSENTTLKGNVTTGGDQDYTGTVTLGAPVILQSSTLELAQGVSGATGDNLTLANSGTATVGGAVSLAGTATLTANGAGSLVANSTIGAGLGDGQREHDAQRHWRDHDRRSGLYGDGDAGSQYDSSQRDAGTWGGDGWRQESDF